MYRFIVVALLIIGSLVGEIMCLVKCVNSDWEAPYKREVIYGVSAVTGLGVIVGYINISDVKK